MSFNIEDVIINEATVTLDFPEAEGAKITIARISADTLEEIREKSVIGKQMNFTTKVLEDKLDDKKFTQLYADAVITGWTGLKAKHLKNLMMCRIPADQLENDVECNIVNKAAILSKSQVVDNFISSTLQSVSVFNQELEEEETKK